MVEVYRIADLEIRPQEHLVLARGRGLLLTARELSVLVALVRRHGRIMSREDLYDAVWGGPLRPEDRSVDVYVHKVRTKLAGALPEWQFIHTHFGFGYRFAAETVITALSQDGHQEVTSSGLRK